MLNRVHYLVAAALPALVACASSSSGREAPSPFSPVLTRAELQEVDARNVHEAIERLRPRWLMVRGGPRSFSMETDIVVYQEKSYLGTVAEGVLQRMGTEGIYEIRHLDGTTAKATLLGIGDRHVEGAIIIYMSRPPG